MIKSHVLFAGPSLPSNDLVRNIDFLQLLPPASAGDILNSMIDNPSLKEIILADGYFYESYSPLHRELLLAIKSGIKVIGCSSMGALRAAELYPFGMHGYGEVFDYYRDNPETGDDEVGLLHLESDADYDHQTIPLVNLRLLAQNSTSLTLVSEINRLIAAFKSVPFYERTWGYAFRFFSRHTHGSSSNVDSASLIKDSYIDYKRRDLSALIAGYVNRSAHEHCKTGIDCVDLAGIQEDVCSGEYKVSLYALAPHRSIAHDIPRDACASELCYLDLRRLVCSDPAELRAVLYRELLLAEARRLPLEISHSDIQNSITILLHKYGQLRFDDLSKRLRLTRHELLCLACEESLIRKAEAAMVKTLSRGLGMPAISSFQRAAGVWPSSDSISISTVRQLVGSLFADSDNLKSGVIDDLLDSRYLCDFYLMCYPSVSVPDLHVEGVTLDRDERREIVLRLVRTASDRF